MARYWEKRGDSTAADKEAGDHTGSAEIVEEGTVPAEAVYAAAMGAAPDAAAAPAAGRKQNRGKASRFPATATAGRAAAK